LWLSGAKPRSVKERFIYPVGNQGDMSDDKKRLQEVNVTIEKLVELLMEVYQERSKLRVKISHGSSDLSV
jgi:hypothetical protein